MFKTEVLRLDFFDNVCIFLFVFSSIPECKHLLITHGKTGQDRSSRIVDSCGSVSCLFNAQNSQVLTSLHFNPTEHWSAVRVSFLAVQIIMIKHMPFSDAYLPRMSCMACLPNRQTSALLLIHPFALPALIKKKLAMLTCTGC